VIDSEVQLDEPGMIPCVVQAECTNELPTLARITAEALAPARQTGQRLAEEAADLLYHLAVSLRGRDVPPADVQLVLDGRRER
jgi:hypothetical protein